MKFVLNNEFKCCSNPRVSKNDVVKKICSERFDSKGFALENLFNQDLIEKIYQGFIGELPALSACRFEENLEIENYLYQCY